MSNTYRKVLSPHKAGLNLRFTYQRYAGDNKKTYAEYLLREDGLLFGRGSRVYNEQDYVALDNFTLLDTDIADIDDCYLLKRDGRLFCIYPGNSLTHRIILPMQSQSAERQPVKVMDDVKQHLHSHPNEFVMLQDGTVYGWGLNWRGSLGTDLKGENISSPVYVTDHAAKLICGDTLYQTLVLKDDQSIWHWSPSHGHYQPIRLIEHVTELRFLPFGNIIVLNEDGKLFLALVNDAADDNKDKLVKQEILKHDIVSVQFSQFLMAAIAKDMSLALWLLPLSQHRQISKQTFSLAAVVQYLIASDSVAALDKNGKLYHIKHYYIGNESKLLVEELAEDIFSIDSLIYNSIECTGVYAIDRKGCLIKIQWSLPEYQSQQCACSTIFEKNVLHTLDRGNFVVCKDGSVWE